MVGLVSRFGRVVQVLQVPECPLVPRLLTLLEQCRAEAAIDLHVEVLVGAYPSPTLVIDGVDVATGRPASRETCCRLDMPSREQVLAALDG